MRTPGKSVGLHLAAFLLGLFLYPNAPRADDPAQLRVALMRDYEPFAGLNLAGEASGILVDIWRLWSRKTGVPVTFVMDNFQDSIEAVRSGRADLHGGLFRNAERAEWLDFSRTLYEVTSSFYHWQAHGPAPSLKSLAGRSVGAIGGSHQESRLRRGDGQLRVRAFAEFPDMLRALARGEIAAAVAEDLHMDTQVLRFGVRGDVLRAPLELMRNSIHAGVPKTRADLRDLVDWGFQQISFAELADVERRWVTSIEDRFYKPRGGLAPFTEEEKDWLARAGVVRIGMMRDWPPISHVDADGRPKGMSPAFIEAVNQRLGGILRIVPGNWQDLYDDVAEKRLDGLLDLTPRRDRLAVFNFTVPYLVVPHVAIARAGEGPFRSLQDLAGKTVALEEGFYTVTRLRRDFPTVTVKEFPDTRAALAAVASGEAQVYVGNQAVARYIMSSDGATFQGLSARGEIAAQNSTLAVGVRKDWSILRDILDKALHGVSITQRESIAGRWITMKSGGRIELTPGEQAWLAANADRPVRVLVGTWPPFHYMENGKAKGVAVDYVRHALEALGLRMEPQHMLWHEAYDAIGRLEKVDLLPSVTRSEDRERNLAFTRDYISFPFVIFTQKEAAIVAGLADLKGKTVAVERNFITQALLEKDHPGIRLMVVDRTPEALEAVSLGKADAYVGNLAAGSYHIERHGFANLKVAAPTEYRNDAVAVAVRRDWPELAAMVDKVIAAMTETEHAAIRGEALALRFPQGIDMVKVMQVVVPIALVILAIMGAFAYWNRRLTREVAVRRQTETELAEKEFQLTAALENMSGGMFMVDKDLVIRVVNRKFQDLFRLPDIKAGMPLRDVLTIRAARGEYGEGSVTCLIEERLDGFRDGSVTHTEEEVLDGAIVEGHRQRTADGGMVCVYNDITVRKKAEQALAEERRKLEELSDKLSRYLSPQIYEAIFAGATDARVQTARKKLTVVFTDIKSFTATTEEMEPEDMTFLLNDYLTKMSEIALEHGGTIDKYVGDAIMVFFGDPETKGVKQDALAAVRMAIAMQRRMVDLRAKWADMGYRLPFHIRCGINTGYCNVGNFGSEQRIDYTIIGGQVNLAARLESICEPDGVVISYETYSHVRDEFDAEPLDPIQVKGIKDPVQPFAVQGIFDENAADERYIRRDDIRGLRLWVDLMRMDDERRQASIKELEEAIDILKGKRIEAADD